MKNIPIETLEEVAERLYPNKSTKGWIDQYSAIQRIHFIEGVKLQQERSYSEEDMKLAFEAGHKKGFSGYPNTENSKELPFDEWFEQFKKK